MGSMSWATKHLVFFTVVSSLVMLYSGTYYSFSAYARKLSLEEGYSAYQINWIPSIVAMMNVVTIVYGLMINATGVYGPAGLGVTAMLLGYLGMILGFYPAKPLVWTNWVAVATYLSLINVGSMYGYLISFRICSIVYPKSHMGLGMGFLSFVYGIASTFSSLIYRAFEDIGAYFLCMGILAMAVFVGATPVFVKYYKPHGEAQSTTATVEEPLPGDVSPPPVRKALAPLELSPGVFRPWLFGPATYVRFEFLAIIIFTLLVTGAHIMTINTIWTQNEAIEFDQGFRSWAITIVFSLTNSLSRLLGGAVYDHVLKPRHIPLSSTLIFCAAGTALINFVRIFTASKAYFVFYVIAFSLFFGVSIGNTVVCCSVYFHPAQYATLLAVMLTALACGSIFFAYVSAWNIQNEGTRVDGSEAIRCIGLKCHQYSLAVVSALCLVALAATILLYLRERNVLRYRLASVTRATKPQVEAAVVA